MVLIWQVILILVALVFLLIASYSDLKRREVPDWLSYGLIFSALGLRAIFSFGNGGGIFLDGLAGLLLCSGVAYFFYSVNFWGGGDSKLLMGVGAVIGLGLNFNNFSLSGFWRAFDFSLFWFFLGLLFFGAIIGLLWSMARAAQARKEFTREFKSLLGSVKKWHFLTLFLSFGFLWLSLFYRHLWPLAVFPAGSFYLLCFVKAVEKSCFIKKIPVGKLVEGDWLAEEVMVGGKRIVGKGKGLEKREIWKLVELQQEGRLKTVLVREGIPLVPSFLAAYLAVLFKGAVISWILGF